MENKNSKKNLRDTDVLIISNIYAVGLKYDKAIKSSPFVTYKSKNTENSAQDFPCKKFVCQKFIPSLSSKIFHSAGIFPINFLCGNAKL